MRDLPEPMHLTIMAVDVAGYGAHTDPGWAELRAGMYDVITEALTWSCVESASVDFVWRGDGILVLVEAKVPKNRLVADLPEALVSALLEHNVGRPDPVRLRLAIHAGEVVRDRYGYLGAAIDTATQVAGSAEFRALHQLTDDLVALAVTEPVYRAVVEQGGSGDPASFRRVVLDSLGSGLIARFRSFGGGPPPRHPPPRGPSGDPGDLHHRSILIVDIEDSDSRPDDVKWQHRCQLREMVSGAVADAGITPGQHEFGDTGDGLRVLFGPDVPKNRLIDPVVFSLVRRLEIYNRTSPPGALMRLRVVLDAGELRRDHENGVYFGSPFNEACWLADSDTLRKGLRSTSAPLALMVSEEIYDGVVRHGYGRIRKEEYSSHVVPLKSRDVTAWLWTPPDDSASAAGCSHDQTSA
jgi:class 3 adenylate cyclase